MADSQKYGRTANLFDDEIESGFYNDNGELVPDTTTSHSTTYIPVDGTTYTISGLWTSTTNFAVYEWDNDKNWLRRSNRQVPASSTITFSIGSDTAFFTLQIKTEHGNIMLNTGSTALPYQPYNAWVHSLRKLTTATANIEPTIYTDGTAITAYTLKGNTVQNGTPTPSNPVEVNGVGVRTENLFDGTVRNAIINDSTGEEQPNANWSCSNFIEVSAEKVTLSWSSDSQFYQAKLGCYEADETFISTETIQGYFYSGTFTIPNNCKYIKLSYSVTVTVSGGQVTRENIMLNTGSTAKPFEPYGYKIPISNGQQTTNIYLGSTQTVRQIKRVDLSTLNWTWNAGSKLYSTRDLTDIVYTSTNQELGVGLCEYYTLHIGSGMSSASADGCLAIDTSMISVHSETQTSPHGYFYYALRQAETAAVNEPLQKIGDYADTLSNATAIPTTEGANSITVDTTVQPSEFTATWTGWHDSSVKEYDGSQWNE